MVEIKKLEDIGLKEVSRKTYIEVKYLKRIVGKDFANLNRVNIYGYLKIIKREYDIDFDEWVSEYKEFCNTNSPHEESKIFTDIKLKPWYSKIYWIAGWAFIILVGVIAYLFIQNKTDNSNNATIDTRYNYYENTSVIEEAKRNLINSAKEHEEFLEIVDANNSTSQDNKTAEEAQNNTQVTIEEIENSLTLSQIHISPKIKIWLGVVNLKTSEKNVYSQIKEIVLDLNDEKLLLTGHGHFDISDENNITKIYREQEPKYFHIKDSKLNEITLDELKALNRGRVW